MIRSVTRPACSSAAKSEHGVFEELLGADVLVHRLPGEFPPQLGVELEVNLNALNRVSAAQKGRVCPAGLI